MISKYIVASSRKVNRQPSFKDSTKKKVIKRKSTSKKEKQAIKFLRELREMENVVFLLKTDCRNRLLQLRRVERENQDIKKACHFEER